MKIDSKQIESAKQMLRSLYSDEGKERVGFLFPNELREVQNVAHNPEEGFMVSAEDILTNTEEEGCYATWHTHPNQDANLSGEDYLMFKNWPELYHFIVGKEDTKAFVFDEAKQAIVEV